MPDGKMVMEEQRMLGKKMVTEGWTKGRGEDVG